MSALRAARRWLAPEVVQTSAMDCGPAALKCLLEGFRTPVSYGRLREACQTDVDGTSIDTLEVVAGQLGLQAEQTLIPADHVALDAAAALPAIAVVRHAETATHFVVVWRRVGPWLQVMDPAQGRRWVSASTFERELFRHAQSVAAEDWRAWAATDAFLAPLKQRMAAAGVDEAVAGRLTDAARADPRWFPLGALDAAVRLLTSLARAGGVASGPDTGRLLDALVRETCASGEDIYALIPADYWSVSPDASNSDPTREMLVLSGAVLLQIAGRRADVDVTDGSAGLSPELAAALTERSPSPLRTVWSMLRQDGLIVPAVLAAAMALATCALTLEALLFRGVFDIAASLSLPIQRLAAALALMGFVAAVLAVETPMVLETLRMGRRLETRFRMALLAKLPRLNDRYFQSRPITDMADRNHNIHQIRNLPSLGLQAVQAAFELGLTVLGVALIDPTEWWLAAVMAGLAMAIPFVVQPMLNERDMRVRNHAGALHGFYLDALLGLAPVRAHRAEKSVSRQHESLLVEWAGSFRGWIRMSLLSGAAQALVGAGLGGALLTVHFLRAGGVTGADLLLAYWTLKLPAIGARLAGLAQQYPAQRNVLLRLMEPLGAPDNQTGTTARPSAPGQTGPVGVTIDGGAVVAGGHAILRDVNLTIAPGEHLAIVGASGAGKSSLLGVLLGWHRLAEGRLRLDGASADAQAIEDLRRRSAWVDPAVHIWNRSLLDNLEYASDGAALESLGAVMETAQLRGVAEKLPRGLQTLLGEGGGLLSGGEGQRVRLARALLTPEPRLALLDEPFRGLDRAQRRSLLAEARAWWRGATLICVTHDVGETLSFPRVLVVDQGRIVEDGDPAALAGRPGRYRELLAAEGKVRDALWGDAKWRRLRLEAGVLADGRAPA